MGPFINSILNFVKRPISVLNIGEKLMRPAPLPLDLGRFTHDLPGNGNTLAMLPIKKNKTKQ